jgi:hypothetical protein
MRWRRRWGSGRKAADYDSSGQRIPAPGTLATLARWCRIRSYLDSAAAHGVTATDAIRAAIEGRPWLPPLQQ